MSSVPRSEVVHASQVRVGDLISEIDSPQGPFYPVLLNVPGLVRIDGRAAGAAEELAVDIPMQLTSGVRRLVAA